MRAILIIFFAITLWVTPAVIAQTPSPDKVFDVIYEQGSPIIQLKVYGTPTNLEKFILVNLLGRKVKEKLYIKGVEILRFDDVTDLSTGLYVIIAKDFNGKTLATTKINFLK